LTVEEYRIV